MIQNRAWHREFAGWVLDGPCEGDWIEKDGPYFEVYHKRPLPGVVAYSADPPSASFEIDSVLYKWLHGYRAWAWVQPAPRAADRQTPC